MLKKPPPLFAVLGRIEKVSFVELLVYEADAKIDTGAYTSTMHCHDMYIERIDNKKYLFFKLGENITEFSTTAFKRLPVKNSFGDKEYRYKIKTTIQIGNKKFLTDVFLADRKNMKVSILIGRKTLQTGKFLVDVSKKHNG